MIKELKYDLTKEDLEKGIKDFPPAKRVVTKIQLFGFLIVILLAVLSGIFLGEYLFPIFVIIFFLILMFLPKKNKFVKILGNYEVQKFNLIINSDENTFTNKNDVSKTVFNWDKILKIDNTESSLLIFTATNQAIIIPKRIFESEQEMNETWGLIQECYNKNKEGDRKN